MKFFILFTFTIFFLNALAGEGAVIGGGGAASNLMQVNSITTTTLPFIDNIEINEKIVFPESAQEKIRLLKRNDIQSVQMIDGTIISNNK